MEQNISNTNLTVGEYIYNEILVDPSKKIIGESLTTIDRRYYKSELHKILSKQSEYHKELRDQDIYNRCIEELYSSNEAYRRSIEGRNLEYLIADDVLMYQRPLKTKKSLIANCQYEKRYFRDSEGGTKAEPLKGIAKSHPLFQEFRIWQFMHNLRLLENDETQKAPVDITADYIKGEEGWCDLYDWLRQQKTVSQKSLLKHYGLLKKGAEDLYRWNYVEDKEYPMGETRAVLLGGLNKAGIDVGFLTEEKELELWHILYSVDDMEDYRKAIHRYGRKQGWDGALLESFEKAFAKLTVCKEKDYGAYSAKALGRLLPLMRCGRYWTPENIDKDTKARVERIATGEVDEKLSLKVRERLQKYDSIEKCSGLILSDACYLVYGRYSETAELRKWDEPEDIDDYLKSFRQHSLNNPIVEHVVTETLRTVRDIWKQYGKPDEIHIELGRELKKTKAERESMTKSITAGEETNQRIRLLLKELAEDDSGVEGVRPQSPSQHELLKIYESGVIESESVPDDLTGIMKNMGSVDAKKIPSHRDVLKYKMWLDQKYVSPYTGRPIPLAKLFTHDYQIEHIIPQSRYFDDSQSNKVICEAEVNLMKNRQLGLEFIKTHGGEVISLNGGGVVKIFTESEYIEHVNKTFGKNRKKREKLLLEEIPDQFIERQLNDSRHISRMMMRLMSNIVRNTDDNGELEDASTVKNVVACNGSITDRLKQDWGLNDVWNSIILPRFERLEEITRGGYVALNREGHKIPNMPIDQRMGFQKKRIDHRHHAMDAITIACTTRDHVNLLNNEAALSAHKEMRYALQRKLRNFGEYQGSDGKMHERAEEFIKPWPTFTQDAKQALEDIVVSFKHNQRVINKTGNKYQAIEDNKKVQKEQGGINWAIRKPMHKETVFGEVNLQLTKWVQVREAVKNPGRIVSKDIRDKVKEKVNMGYSAKQIMEVFDNNKETWSEVKNGKVEVWYYTAETNDRYFATRVSLIDLMSGATTKEAAEKVIASITDSGIRKILMAHLAAEGYNAEDAFSADGIDRMNGNIKALNGGKNHQPIKKVRKFEQSNKFKVGETGVKRKKYVEGAKGTNLFFAIYTDKKGERGYATLPLNMVIDLQKKYQLKWKDYIIERMKSADESCKAEKLLYILSPGDLVYVPTEGEKVADTKSIDKRRIYKMVSCTRKALHCIPMNVASIIIDKVEFEAMNKMQTTIDKKYNIQKVCLPVKTDRLGNIVSIG